MAAPDRIQQLLRFLENDPDDAFTIYALALEYRKAEPEKAAGLLRNLINRHPDYLPAYYMTATLFTELGKTNEAVIVLEKGIALAARLNNLKTLGELREALQQLGE